MAHIDWVLMKDKTDRENIGKKFVVECLEEIHNYILNSFDYDKKSIRLNHINFFMERYYDEKYIDFDLLYETLGDYIVNFILDKFEN